MSLFAQGRFLAGWSFADLAIAIVVIAAIIALVVVAIKGFGLQIPGWVIQCFWICLIAVVVIIAIRFVAGL